MRTQRNCDSAHSVAVPQFCALLRSMVASSSSLITRRGTRYAGICFAIHYYYVSSTLRQKIVFLFSTLTVSSVSFVSFVYCGRALARRSILLTFNHRNERNLFTSTTTSYRSVKVCAEREDRGIATVGNCVFWYCSCLFGNS